MKDKILKVLKILYKILPFFISALGGGAIAACAGCKCGSLVSLAAPVI